MIFWYKLKNLIKWILPRSAINNLGLFRYKLRNFNFRNFYLQSTIKLSNKAGLDVYPAADMYSPLPNISLLREKMNRWYRPSEMIGIKYDVEAMKDLLKRLEDQYSDEYKKNDGYNSFDSMNFGPGFTKLDAKLLYYMVRDIQPNNYIEIGSGLSTKYCMMAAKQNAEMGKPAKVTCIEPYPYEMLYSIPQIEIIAKEVQDIEFSVFENLDAGDILFIDTSHIVKLDGDVPFLFLDVIPRLKRGVFIHVHDIPFPYNVPYPQDLYIFGKNPPKWWPWFFTEAMLLQAFLSYNEAFKIIASIPLIRHHDEKFLNNNLSGYIPISEYKIKNQSIHGYPPCSIWIEKIKK